MARSRVREMPPKDLLVLRRERRILFRAGRNAGRPADAALVDPEATQVATVFRLVGCRSPLGLGGLCFRGFGEGRRQLRRVTGRSLNASGEIEIGWPSDEILRRFSRRRWRGRFLLCRGDCAGRQDDAQRDRYTTFSADLSGHGPLPLQLGLK